MRRNFTIIELLVVIAVIAIIAGLLFPLLGKMKEKGRKASCIGQLRQLGVAVNVYAGNNEDRLPVCIRIGDGPDDPYSISNVLDVSSKQIFHCPADNYDKFDGKTYFNRYGTSYEWNTFMNGMKIPKTSLALQDMTITSPMMNDAENFHGSFGKNYLYVDGRVLEKLEVKVE